MATINVSMIEKTTVDEATLYVSANNKQAALDLMATNPDIIVSEITLPVPIDLTVEGNMTEDIRTVIGDIQNSPDVVSTSTYETSGQIQRLTQHVLSSTLVGYKITTTRTYTHPITHPESGKIDSITETLEVV